MIKNGEKREEYREIKPYYTSRIANLLSVPQAQLHRALKSCDTDMRAIVRFRNGYAKTSPQIETVCSVHIGTGRTEWGAAPGKKYYVFSILADSLCIGG